MKRLGMVIMVAAFSLMIYGNLEAKSGYLDSFNTQYGTSGTALNTCNLCHGSSYSVKNNYAVAYKNSGYDFAAIESQDSDSDGFTNITEINARTFPGDSTSKPAPAGDTAAPTVTAFSIPGTASSLTVAITTLTATDNVGVTGYLVTETSMKPAATAGGWSGAAPTSYTFSTQGAKTLYAWAKDAAGNVSNSMSASVTITLPPAGDTTAPTVTAFSIPATSSSLTVPVTTLTASDNVGVTGYLLTESATKPAATAGGWSGTAPTSYAFASQGAKTLYAWVKDAAGNVSTSRSASVTITMPSAAVTSLLGVFKAGTWYLDLDGNDTWDGDTADALHLFGKFGDKPVVGDWDGTGTARIGVFRNGTWRLDVNGNGTWDKGVDLKYGFGMPGDKPVVGDWDGTGTVRVGVFRNGTWRLDANGNGTWDKGVDLKYEFGMPGDKPVVGDWDGTGTERVGVFRNGTWRLDVNGNGTWDKGVDLKYEFGWYGDKPVVGDWDGTGVTRIGVVRAGVWYLDMDGDGTWDQATDVSLTFGAKGAPVTGTW